MSESPRLLIDELIDWIDREIERAERVPSTTDENQPQSSEENREAAPRERLRVPASIPA
jgi:hypothetical protein